MTKKEKISFILTELEKLYPKAICSLNYRNPFELLIATQLSAQCTDVRVNIVTKDLFKKYSSPWDFANTSLEQLQQDIKSTGFYRNKAKNIVNCSKKLIEKYNGEVPSEMEKLLELDGVGRKTANVVRGDAFNIPGIVVDTHVKRISNRLGLTKNQDPVKIEYDLMKIIPKIKWTLFSHQLVYYGREICAARKPKCDRCSLSLVCNYIR